MLIENTNKLASLLGFLSKALRKPNVWHTFSYQHNITESEVALNDLIRYLGCEGFEVRIEDRDLMMKRQETVSIASGASFRIDPIF